MKYLFKTYRNFVSPFFHVVSQSVGIVSIHSGCRFEPTCSCYCEQAFAKYGFFKGFYKSLLRVSKCHPFSNTKGIDPA